MERQTLWLAVGVALVPIGALVALTVNDTETGGENKYIRLIEMQYKVSSLKGANKDDVYVSFKLLLLQ